jgi:hypothetical protein
MKHWQAAMVAFIITMISAGSALAGSVTLYSESNFRGDRVTINRDIDSLEKIPPWNNRTRSLVVHSGTWKICKDKKYDHCRTLYGGAKVPDVGTIENLRAGISSLREVDRDDHGGDDGHRHDDRPSSHGGGAIIWDRSPDRGYRSSKPQNQCQSRVEDAFRDRFGKHGDSEFVGNDRDGTIWWKGDAWNYRCAGGQINIWR